jgi:hypothetical protein
MLAAAALMLGASGIASAAPPAGNLLQNPGADAGEGEVNSTGTAIPEWGTAGRLSAVQYGAADGFPTTLESFSIGGGANFFSGGINDAVSIGEQIIDLPPAQPEIDAGRVSVVLSAHIGGRLNDPDNLRVTAEFQDEFGDQTFLTLQVGPVTAAERGDQTKLLPRSTTAVVPGGTRQIRVTITANRTAGQDGQHNNGYADNLSLAMDVYPTAVNDTATVSEDANATAVGVLANDTNTDGGPKQVASVTQPANGTVAITGGGSGLTYRPNTNYCNSQVGGAADTFTYKLNGGSTGSVAMTVTCVDDPPVAVNDTATVSEDANATAVGVLANDTNTDGGPKQVASVTQPANGTVAITGGGSGLTYKPNANYCNSQVGGAIDTFTYKLNGGSTGTVAMTVTCVNDLPVAVNDAATVGLNANAIAVGVLANDTDPEGDAKQVASVTQPANGTVAITGGGTGLTYRPNASYCNNRGGAADTFTYTLNGGSTATVAMTVTCAELPVAVEDSARTTEDADVAAIDVLANDTDPDGGPKQVVSVSPPANGTVAITAGGTDVTYRPNANYCNDDEGVPPDIFTYALNGGSSTRVDVVVACVDDLPVAVNDAVTGMQKRSGQKSSPLTVDVLANDPDADGGPKQVASVTQTKNATVAILPGGSAVTYRAKPGYCNWRVDGVPDTFTYTLSGGSTATVAMTIVCLPYSLVNAGRVSGRTTPEHAEKRPYAFTTTGGLTLPPYCAPGVSVKAAAWMCIPVVCPTGATSTDGCTRPSKATVCKGTVTVRFYKFQQSVATRATSVGADCRYRTKVTFNRLPWYRRGRLRVDVRFEGNTFLRKRGALWEYVRSG